MKKFIKKLVICLAVTTAVSLLTSYGCTRKEASADTGSSVEAATAVDP
ncbi:MAG: hypothetical protein J5379_07985 [Clostridiales bacterium]|nr:hypothetical protein [Clostridiales bacterium]